MKKIKITESQIKEVLAQIDAMGELGFKERGCLRLLAEEMFSMCGELLDVYTLDFEIKKEDNQYTLSGAAKTNVDQTKREQLLSVSSNGKNAANKGVKGTLGAVLELFSMGGNPEYYDSTLAYGMHGPVSLYSSMWSLSRYIEVLEEKNSHPQWDELEKSIIANFSDDVSIGVRSGWLEITIIKTF